MYAAQRPHKSTETWSGGNSKHGKVVKFDDNTQEANVMQNYYIPIPRKEKGKKVATKKRKIKMQQKKDVPMVSTALIYLTLHMQRMTPYGKKKMSMVMNPNDSSRTIG